ncbi:MAG: hypothetical protein ONB46_23660 [candidate division KSB1 bacterium]|nr:hypothetical protein [candidate division KSB1 bacterium]MDZ7368864.1 hypothetical protein [candidate division KSB1 bacterium]
MQTAAFKITPAIKQEIVKIVDKRIKEAHVTKEDFSELKNIVKELGVKVGELAEAQKRTELRVEELAEAQKRTELRVEELAEAQKRTELRVEELAEAQKRTEIRVEELAAAQKELTEAQKRTEIRLEELTVAIKELHGEIGGVGRSAGYALENEAYRHLPELLQGKYGIVVKEKMIRSQIGGKEINVFGRAARDGQDVLVVGEARTRLDERRGAEEAFEALEEKVQAVMAEYGQVEIVKILVTHFARKGFLELAREKGIIVVQSFEW